MDKAPEITDIENFEVKTGDEFYLKKDIGTFEWKVPGGRMSSPMNRKKGTQIKIVTALGWSERYECSIESDFDSLPIQLFTSENLGRNRREGAPLDPKSARAEEIRSSDEAKVRIGDDFKKTRDLILTAISEPKVE